jgi:aspartate/glutamate racemase
MAGLRQRGLTRVALFGTRFTIETGLFGALRNIARAIRQRDRIDAVVLAGTDLNLLFDEATAGFPPFDCAAAHIGAILDRATSGLLTNRLGSTH